MSPHPSTAEQLHDPDAIDPSELLDARRLRDALIRKAAAARKDPVKFFDFAMREERTLNRIKAAPHQRLLFEFVSFYEHCVIRMPIGSSKTFSMAALTLLLLGNDPTERGAIISATQGQAAKPLSMVQDYLDEPGYYPELGLVFPNLRPSRRLKDPWTQSKLVVDRPPGIRDPSLVAIGIDGALPGARLSWILVDDVLTEENTRTSAGRAKVNQFFGSTVLSRKDITGAKIVVCNTPWHPEDLTFKLEKAGWPTLTMGIDGTITITNADDFDSEEIRPASSCGGKHYRLKAHDAQIVSLPFTRTTKKQGTKVERPYPGIGAQVVQTYVTPDGRLARLPVDNDNGPSLDRSKLPGEPLRQEHFDLDEVVPLWPGKFHPEDIDELRAVFRNDFSQLYLCKCRDDDSALCKVAWIEVCKRQGQALGWHSLVQEYRGGNLTVTGVDLAMGQGEEHDSTAFFTFEVIPSITIPAHGDRPARIIRNARRLLDLEVGKFRGRIVVDKLLAKAARFNSIIRVETNAAQDFLRQWTLDVDASVPIRAHVTGAAKNHRINGVAGLFIELENGAWIIPCDELGNVPPAVQVWIDDCLNYRPPPAHTGDALMASYLARAQARELDFGGEDTGGSLMAALGAR